MGKYDLTLGEKEVSSIYLFDQWLLRTCDGTSTILVAEDLDK